MKRSRNAKQDRDDEPPSMEVYIMIKTVWILAGEKVMGGGCLRFSN